jgi:hypothetical protein
MFNCKLSVLSSLECIMCYRSVFPHSSIGPTMGLMAKGVTVWYQSLVSMLSLDGLDKWSLDQCFEKKLCLED